MNYGYLVTVTTFYKCDNRMRTRVCKRKEITLESCECSFFFKEARKKVEVKIYDVSFIENII